MSSLENNSQEASQMAKLAISSDNDEIEQSEISIEEEKSGDEDDDYEQSGGDDNEEELSDGDNDEEDNQSAGSSNVAIDLSENEFYKGMCTLLEDQEGNNILEYISLLHSELIGHNKTMKDIRKDLSTIAECAKIMTQQMSKGKK